MEKITGKNNELIKGVKKLLSSSKERNAQGVFVLEGARLVFDVLNSLYEVKFFMITENALSKYEKKARLMISKSEKSYIISEDISDRLSDTKNSQGVFAVCRINPEKDNKINPDGKYIMLDNVQDPANLGAIVRTAEALGTDGVIVSGGCDIYNPKSLRAAMGSMLRIHIMQIDNSEEFLENARKKGLSLFATVPDSSAARITDSDFSGGVICVIGNEANGVSEKIIRLCDEKITIPMLGKAESLNASVAAAITMWEMLR